MATITLSGTASTLITYTGTTVDGSAIVVYMPIASIGPFYKAKTDRISIQVDGHMDEYVFDSEAQRDAAIVTLLTYF